MTRRDHYHELEDKTFKMFVARDLDESDAGREELRKEVHEWVETLKVADQRTDDRVSKLTAIFYSLLVSITVAVVTAAALGLLGRK